MPYGQWLKALPSRPNVVVEVKQQVIYGKVKHTSLFDDKEKEKEKPINGRRIKPKKVRESSWGGRFSGALNKWAISALGPYLE